MPFAFIGIDVDEAQQHRQSQQMIFGSRQTASVNQRLRKAFLV